MPNKYKFPPLDLPLVEQPHRAFEGEFTNNSSRNSPNDPSIITRLDPNLAKLAI